MKESPKATTLFSVLSEYGEAPGKMVRRVGMFATPSRLDVEPLALLVGARSSAVAAGTTDTASVVASASVIPVRRAGKDLKSMVERRMMRTAKVSWLKNRDGDVTG